MSDNLDIKPEYLLQVLGEMLIKERLLQEKIGEKEQALDKYREQLDQLKGAKRVDVKPKELAVFSAKNKKENN